ncbi:MAG TPA: PKD domain-containing protein, partial [Methanocella sp.]
TLKFLTIRNFNDGICIEECDSVVIGDCNITNNGNNGIDIFDSDNNYIFGNNLIDNEEGMELEDVAESMFIFNIIRDCEDYGIYMTDSEDTYENEFYLNYFTNNEQNAFCGDQDNYWNLGADQVYRVGDVYFEGPMGNYWDDYTGADAGLDGVYDGIGCGPYSFPDTGNYVRDNQPLINSSIKPCYAARNLRTGIEYAYIQDAVDMAAPGDTIRVYGGEYDEELEIDQRLTLTGDPEDMPEIYGVIRVYADNVTITGLAILESEVGIYVEDSNNTKITDCDIVYHLFAVYLENSNYTTIQGNWIEETIGGIYLDGSNNTRIYGNDFTCDLDFGDKSLSADEVRLASDSDIPEESGVIIVESENCTVDSNNFWYCPYGVVMTDTLNVTIRNNNITGTFDDYDDDYEDYSEDISILSDGPLTMGVGGIYCHNITILKNNITGFESGICMAFTGNDTLRDNNITYSDRPELEVEKTELKITVSPGPEEGYYGIGDYNGILLENGDNVTIQSNNITHFELGLGLYGMSNVTMRGNNVTGPGYQNDRDEDRAFSAEIRYYGIGIMLFESPDNTIVGNIVSDNAWGIVLDNDDFDYGVSSADDIAIDMVAETYTENNSVFLNYLIDNYYGCFDLSGRNHWNSTVTRSYDYKGVGHVNYTGNYWSDYTGIDANGDGIGDTPMFVINPYMIGSLSGSGVHADSWTPGVDYFPMIFELQRPPKVSFHANVTLGNAPLCVQFTDDSSRNPDHWEWQFGDGTANSTEQNPVHTYMKNGTYWVNLTASNDYGSGTWNMEDMGYGYQYIIVLPALPSNITLDWLKTYPQDSYYERQGYRFQEDAYGYGVAKTTAGFVLAGYNYGDFITPLLIRANSAGTMIENQTNLSRTWEKTFEPVPEPDGGITYAGTTDSGAIIVNRLFANGMLNWTCTLPGTFSTHSSIAKTADGGYLVVGSKSVYKAGGWHYGSNYNRDYYFPYVARLDAGGTLINSNVSDEHFRGWYYQWGHGRAVEPTSDGGYILAGQTDWEGTSSDVYLAKAYPNNTLEWSRLIGVVGREDNVWDVKETYGGGYLVVGSNWNESRYDTDVWLFKVKADGTDDWTRTYYGLRVGDSVGYSILETSDNGYMIAADTITVDGNYHPYLIKTDPDGNELWNATLPFNIEEGYVSIAPAGGDSFVIGGTARHFVNIPGSYNDYYREPYIAKLTMNVPLVYPAADFTFDPKDGFYPLTVHFTDLSINATSWSWDFGDGGHSTDRNSVHTYAAHGTYTVTLTAINPNGTDMESDVIKVYRPLPPVASFVANVTSGNLGLCVNFTDLSTNNPDTWLWEFGDGNTSTERSPNYTYQRSGTYAVTLRASNAYGGSFRTMNNYITVTGPVLYVSVSAPYSKPVGSDMQYSLYYANWGQLASNHTIVNMTLPTGVEYTSSPTGTYDAETRNVTWTLGDLGYWGYGYPYVNVRISDSVASSTRLTVRATISASNVFPASNLVYTATTLVTQPILPPNASVSGITYTDSTGVPGIYWGDTTVFKYNTSDEAIGVDISILAGGRYINNSMAGGPPQWSYSIRFYDGGYHGYTDVKYTVHYRNETTANVSFSIYIDPAGYVYDVETGARIVGASVWLQRPDGAGGWENIPTGLAPPTPMTPDTNPQITDSAGGYAWDVLAGTYRVHVVANHYYPTDSRTVVIVDTPVYDLHVGLTKIPDEVKPTSTLTLQGTAGNNGWYLSGVQATLSAVDNADGLGVKSIEYSYDNALWSPYTGPLSFESNGVRTLYYRAIDNADNVEAVKSQAIKIDNIAPTISGAILTAPNANGWYTSNVLVHFTASDSFSGIVSVTPDALVTVDGAGQMVVGTACDGAGNSASVSIGNINIDRANPAVSGITLPSGIVQGTMFTASAGFTEMNRKQAVWEWGDGTTSNGTMSDTAISGSHTYNTAGTYTVKLTVTDRAGNTGSATATATVATAVVTAVPTATPTPVPTAPVSPTPVPAPGFVLISLALIGGAMLVATMRKK